jgi:hypothetical protein
MIYVKISSQNSYISSRCTQSMDPVTWAKAKGPAYVGLQVGATICVVVLIAFTVMRIINPSFGSGIEVTFLAAAAAILPTVAARFDRSDTGSNSVLCRVGRRH